MKWFIWDGSAKIWRQIGERGGNRRIEDYLGTVWWTNGECGEQWRAVDVHLSNPANSLPRFAEYMGKTATVLRFVVEMSVSQIIAGILNIPKTWGDHSASTGTFGERGERLVKTWECFGKILRISQIWNSSMSQYNSRQPAEFQTAVTLLCLIRFTKSFEFRMLHVSIKKVEKDLWKYWMFTRLSVYLSIPRAQAQAQAHALTHFCPLDTHRHGTSDTL